MNELYKLIGKTFIKEELESKLEKIGYDVLGEFEFYWNIIDAYGDDETEIMLEIYTDIKGMIHVDTVSEN